MKKRTRIRRIARWPALALLLLMAVATYFAFYRPLNFFLTAPYAFYEVSLLEGGLRWRQLPLVPESGVSWQFVGFHRGGLLYPNEKSVWLPAYEHHATANWQLFIPMWILLLLTTPLCLALWWPDLRRRIPPGHCPNCRYDLRGLPPNSPCPECGKGATA